MLAPPPIRPACGGSECVRVFVRVRPKNQKEKEAPAGPDVVMGIRTHPGAAMEPLLVDSSAKSVAIGDPSKDQSDSSTMYTFDGVFGPMSAQQEVFDCVGVQVVSACLEGYNGSIYVYGQTGTGKTFTMLGPPRGRGNDQGLRGLTSRIIENIFHELRTKQRDSEGTFSYMCKISCVEIYREALTDLFDQTGQQLQLRDDIRKGVYVDGLSEHTVYNSKEAELIVRRALVKRHVGSTVMNDQSSRSHCVVMLRVATKLIQSGGVTQTKESSLNLVDLAGSERQQHTVHGRVSGADSQARVKEAGAINKSLSVLTSVIYSLSKARPAAARQSTFTHFRDSKLTFLLRDSLGGNSITSIIATISPSATNFGETLSTIKFAARAKRIKCQAVLNESLTGTVETLTAELEAARRQLAALTAGQAQLRPPIAVNDGGTGAFNSRGGSPTSGEQDGEVRAPEGSSSVLRRRIISLQILLAGSLARERELEEVKAKQHKWAVYWEETAKSLKAFEEAGRSLTDLVTGRAGRQDGEDAEDDDDDDREEEIRLLRALVENHPEKARRELLELELQQQIEDNAALRRQGREIRQEHEARLRAERRRRQSVESNAGSMAGDGLIRTFRSGMLPGRDGGQAVSAAVGATGLRFITESGSDGSPHNQSDFTESDDAESLDGVHLDAGDTGGGPVSDEEEEGEVSGSSIGAEGREMDSVQMRHLKREIRMLLAENEELRQSAHRLESAPTRHQTPEPLEGVAEGSSSFGELGVAPSPEYRFGEIIQASPGLSPSGTPALMRVHREQSPQASPPQAWSAMVPISNECLSSDGEEELKRETRIDPELVREVASLCRDVDTLVEKIRQADTAVVLRSSSGDDFEEIDVEKSLKKSPWLLDEDASNRGPEALNDSPTRQLAQSASMSRIMRYTAATVLNGGGGGMAAGGKAGGMAAAKVKGLSSVQSTPHLSSLLDKRGRGPPPAASREQTRTLSRNANTASSLLRNKSTMSLHAISELELSVFDERTGHMVTTASPRTAAITGSASSAALPTMEEILGEEEGGDEEGVLLRSTKETLKRLLIELELVSSGYQQLSDDFQKLLEDYESKVEECEFFQTQWNQQLTKAEGERSAGAGGGVGKVPQRRLITDPSLSSLISRSSSRLCGRQRPPPSRSGYTGGLESSFMRSTQASRSMRTAADAGAAGTPRAKAAGGGSMLRRDGGIAQEAVVAELHEEMLLRGQALGEGSLESTQTLYCHWQLAFEGSPSMVLASVLNPLVHQGLTASGTGMALCAAGNGKRDVPARRPPVLSASVEMQRSGRLSSQMSNNSSLEIGSTPKSLASYSIR
ncbi:hypothetical protein FOL47_001961 [Perkinsus chesapeaki]|uniref:Kinesin motor domain-containing protein n=1 Tax=Perkinsus chesapeaki TaxID=330153 RepID=A0A7J6N0K0_PERCH|nr:hypothetical protein FOL47_001961 [Perkinsus chesapeaki]